MNNGIHTETAFESAIVGHLTENGWHLGNASDFSRDLAFDKKAVISFIQTSQHREWTKLQSYYKDDTENKFIQRLFKELDLRGMLDVIRHGITDSGVKFKLAYFRPDSGLNPETIELYKKNKLYVARQVLFSSKNNKSIDLLLSLNGLPVATIELKNHFTGQTVKEAMEQYRTSRDPKELLFQFKKRALVHFTLDPDEVYLTTKLDSVNTRFLPFNKGFKNGAGNPPAKDYASYRSSYFWEEMLSVDSWLELIGRFMHLQKEEYLIDGKKYWKEAMLFPRYHQVDVVRKLTADTKANGPGRNYLIEHSAGSGKSNSIAWLAYRLSSLYDPYDKKAFDSIIVITDRNVLDQQLQNTIYQFEHKQAIEEGFILDVLRNYTSYKEYYGFSKSIEDDPELNKRKAAKAIGRFASLHPHSLAQKTEVMVEHFRQITMKKIGGKAKAMVVTASRKHALRYYLEFKDYIKEKGYEKDIHALVAFSGTVFDDLFPEGVTESQLNGFGELELPGKFATDEFQVLLVADKYQYGFDQPLLHTMYVDKKLSGVRAVQTLSRLNRTHPGKEDTFVLDFTNDRQTIIDSFQPYYELTTITETTDPNHLYDLKGKMDAANVYYQSEVDAFAKVFYKPGSTSIKDQGKMYAFIDPAVDRFKALQEEPQDEFKKSVTSYVRLYSFLSQIMPFQDVDLEKLYSFGRFLLSKLPKSDYTERLKLDNEVALEYYRLQKIAEGDLVLQVQGEYGLDPTTEAGISKPKEEKDRLSNIIKVLNDKYGTDFNDVDKLFFDQIEEELYQDEDLKKRALNNQIDNFKYAFEEVFINKLIERMDSNQEIFDKIMENPEFKNDVKDWLTKKIYQRFNEIT
ncbi:MAG: type I restriction endonuclease subunit R [Nitrospirae bacterium]|nr:type I restriction endonuclease subunit R [Nitrospirota bacterium]